MEWSISQNSFIPPLINLGMNNDLNYGWAECAIEDHGIPTFLCNEEKDATFNSFPKIPPDGSISTFIDLARPDINESVKTESTSFAHDDSIQNYHIESVNGPEQPRNVYDSSANTNLRSGHNSRIVPKDAYDEDSNFVFETHHMPFVAHGYSLDRFHNMNEKRGKQDKSNLSPGKSTRSRRDSKSCSASTSGGKECTKKQDTEIPSQIDNESKLNIDVENMAKKIFSKKTRTLLRWLNSGVNPKDIKAIMNKMWLEMSDEQKKPFYLEAGATDKIISLKLAYMNDSDNYKQNTDILLSNNPSFTRRAPSKLSSATDDTKKAPDVELELALEDLFHSEKCSKEWVSFENDKDRYLRNQNQRQEEVIQMREKRKVRRGTRDHYKDEPKIKRLKMNDMLENPFRIIDDCSDTLIHVMDDENTEESSSDVAENESIHQIYSKFESSPEKPS